MLFQTSLNFKFFWPTFWLNFGCKVFREARDFKRAWISTEVLWFLIFRIDCPSAALFKRVFMFWFYVHCSFSLKTLMRFSSLFLIISNLNSELSCVELLGFPRQRQIEVQQGLTVCPIFSQTEHVFSLWAFAAHRLVPCSRLLQYKHWPVCLLRETEESSGFSLWLATSLPTDLLVHQTSFLMMMSWVRTIQASLGWRRVYAYRFRWWRLFFRRVPLFVSCNVTQPTGLYGFFQRWTFFILFL